MRVVTFHNFIYIMECFFILLGYVIIFLSRTYTFVSVLILFMTNLSVISNLKV